MANDNIEFEEDDILLDSSKPAITPEAGGLQKALPYIGMALSAARSMRSGDAAGAGMSIISGLSDIKNMQATAAKERDMATKRKIEIKEMKQQQEILNKESDWTLTERFAKLTPSEQKLFRERYDVVAGEDHMLSEREFNQLEKTLKRDNAFVQSMIDAGNQDRRTDAQILRDKSLKIGQTKGFDHPDYIAAKKEADASTKHYNDGVTVNKQLLIATTKYNKRMEDLAQKVTPESMEVYERTGKASDLVPREKEKTYTPQLKKWTKRGATPMYVDMNKPEDVEAAMARGFEESADKDAFKTEAIMDRIINKFNADPTVRQTEKMDQFANLIVTVSESDNPIGHASLETLMARASGEVGNLSEADKKPFGGSRALNERISQTFSQLYSGRKTPENLKFIGDLARTFRESGKRKKIAIARERAKQFSHRKDLTEEEIFQALSPLPDIPETSEAGTAESFIQKHGGGR